MKKNRTFISGLPGNEVIHIRCNHKMECVFIKNIIYIESDGPYSDIYTGGRKPEKKKICRTLKYIEKYLKKKGFLRCHRHYLINLTKVDYFCSEDRKISVSGLTIEVSRRVSAKCFRLLIEYGIKDTGKATV